ncbi:MAG: hypothetical protein J5669_03950 [Bacteroidales bacterium]|nr:hypothetical protein [Bacteroidales bacterium]
MKKAFYIVTVLILALSCSRKPVQPEEPDVQTAGATTQVMVLFAPGQLGDNGYADAVLSGLYFLKKEGTFPEEDAPDVRFISANTYKETYGQLAAWLSNSINPFYGKPYERRLLVITEPYMMEWFDELYVQLKETDDILVLKVNEDDIQEAAADYALGERIHGLNISAAGSARAFCDYMKKTKPEENSLPFFRLYSEQIVAHRDSLYEVFSRELGGEDAIFVTPLSTEASEGIFSSTYEATALESAFEWANLMQVAFNSSLNSFAVVDLGAANSGWDYFLMDAPAKTFTSILLDARPMSLASRFIITRDFGKALSGWCVRWVLGDGVPVMEEHGNWDGYCTDNIPKTL